MGIIHGHYTHGLGLGVLSVEVRVRISANPAAHMPVMHRSLHACSMGRHAPHIGRAYAWGGIGHTWGMHGGV